MQIADVNIFVHAFRASSPEHERCRGWLTRHLDGAEPLGVSELVLSGFVRIMTNHRILEEPSSLGETLAFCGVVREGPSTVPIRPGPRHWDIFAGLCRSVHATANLVPDAYHAAMAIENGATWVTTDRGFARFPGLRWATPAEAE